MSHETCEICGTTENLGSLYLPDSPDKPFYLCEEHAKGWAEHVQDSVAFHPHDGSPTRYILGGMGSPTPPVTTLPLGSLICEAWVAMPKELLNGRMIPSVKFHYKADGRPPLYAQLTDLIAMDQDGATGPVDPDTGDVVALHQFKSCSFNYMVPIPPGMDKRSGCNFTLPIETFVYFTHLLHAAALGPDEPVDPPGGSQ